VPKGAMQVEPLIGIAVDAIETPALIVELDALEHNIAAMAAFAGQAGLRLRPHGKSHRCPAIAVRQVSAGAVGLCAQTVGEAEALVAAGIPDVLVTNEILSPGKLRRLAALAGRATIAVLCDSAAGVHVASQAAAEAETELGLVVEIDVGMGRCGVAPGIPARELVLQVIATPNVGFRGIQAYHGRAQHLTRYADRESAIASAGEAVRTTLAALEAAGVTCPLVTGAGTGTHRLEAASGLWHELQAGSYIFMDREYAEIEGPSGVPEPAFAHSLFVLASVISISGNRAIVDAGLKSLSAEKGLPLVHDLLGVTAIGMSDEHTLLEAAAGAAPFHYGQRVRLIPGHCDPTVNLHDWIAATRGDVVAEAWPIVARGASQ
jgi:3-hydroxy-D-aspartate aldolase